MSMGARIKGAPPDLDMRWLFSALTGVTVGAGAYLWMSPSPPTLKSRQIALHPDR